MDMLFFFFFQAEDGIRDADVTGVQTCALPISTYSASVCRGAGFAYWWGIVPAVRDEAISALAAGAGRVSLQRKATTGTSRDGTVASEPGAVEARSARPPRRSSPSRCPNGWSDPGPGLSWPPAPPSRRSRVRPLQRQVISGPLRARWPRVAGVRKAPARRVVPRGRRPRPFADGRWETCEGDRRDGAVPGGRPRPRPPSPRPEGPRAVA